MQRDLSSPTDYLPKNRLRQINRPLRRVMDIKPRTRTDQFRRGTETSLTTVGISAATIEQRNDEKDPGGRGGVARFHVAERSEGPLTSQMPVGHHRQRQLVSLDSIGMIGEHPATTHKS
jgi:hypothetical protein